VLESIRKYYATSSAAYINYVDYGSFWVCIAIYIIGTHTLGIINDRPRH
jgi:succinate-acetate transporter protein